MISFLVLGDSVTTPCSPSQEKPDSTVPTADLLNSDCEIQEAMDLKCSKTHKQIGVNSTCNSALQMIAEMYSDDDDQ